MSPSTKVKSFDKLPMFASGLVGYWPLWDTKLGSDGKVLDLSKYHNNGTVFGALWTPQGRRWDAVGDDYINIDSALAPLASTTKGYWGAWVKLDDAIPVNYPTMISFGDTNANEYILWYVEPATGKLIASARNAAEIKWTLKTNAVALSNGIYAYLALIQDGVSPILLINGVEVAQTFSVSTDKTAWFADLTGLDNGTVGCTSYNSAGNTQFIISGNVGEVVLSSRDLSIPEVQNYIQPTKWRYQ